MEEVETKKFKELMMKCILISTEAWALANEEKSNKIIYQNGPQTTIGRMAAELFKLLINR